MLGDVLLDVEEDDGKIWKFFWCEGCEQYHGIQLNQNLNLPFWSWDGNNDYPTFTPSMIIKWNDQVLCHFLIKNGMIQYSEDSQHMFAGLTIPLSEA